MEFNDINKQLRNCVKEWENTCFEPYMGAKYSDCDKEGYFSKNKEKMVSCPFYVGLTDDYLSSKATRVMVIGQEARHFGTWKDNRNDIGYNAEESQKWSIEYLLYQLKMPVKNSSFNISFNKSKFWHLFRTLKKNGYSVCWNNVDKVYYSRGNNEYKGVLTYTAEEHLSAQYGGKSLLQREIEICAPDIILFVTGPKYYLSMEAAFGLPLNETLKNKLNKNNKIVDITKDIKLNIPTYWTYHPANRIINSVQEFLDKISNYNELFEK